MRNAILRTGCHSPAEAQFPKDRYYQVDIQCNYAGTDAGEKFVEAGRVGGEAQEATGAGRDRLTDFVTSVVGFYGD